MANLMKCVVFDRRTEENTSMDLGDFVTCLNCGRTMLVNLGTAKCPECDEETLCWEDEENSEVSEDFFYNNVDYVLADMES